ncbi:MAG: mandelate racemase/muconate lactonizing enzyme family protein [Chloroflexi bacterium]|nr:mandelate racemase/muconate lactonizing enzyme family protein [Chloroflexota bacterium]
MRITAVRATTADVPLPRPIVMGEIRFDSREYLIVEIETDTGHTGIGLGMTRNSPAASIVDRSLRPHLLGTDPLLTEHHWEQLYYRNLPMGQRGVFMRALSAVDIALWDLKAQAAGMPLWRLLGGLRGRVPTLIAGGYPASDRTLADLAGELSDYVARGFRMIKIAAGELDEDSERLRVSRQAVGPDIALAYDAHWAWRDLLSVTPVVRRWADLDLLFIEDPYPSEQVAMSAQLRDATGCRLALGEDTVGRWAFHDLLMRQHPDVLRVDATVLGGVSEAVKVCALAGTLSIPVLPHVFPEVHVHLAAAFPSILAVEMTDRAYETESLHRLFRRWVHVEDGAMVAPEEPGLGVELDRHALERYAVRSASF